MIRKLSSLQLRKKGQQAYQVAASNWAGEGTSSTWPVHSVVRRMIDTECPVLGKPTNAKSCGATLPLVRGFLLPIAIALLGRRAMLAWGVCELPSRRRLGARVRELADGRTPK